MHDQEEVRRRFFRRHADPLNVLRQTRQRLRDAIILTLRTLAVLLLGFTVARPFIEQSDVRSADEAASIVRIVVLPAVMMVFTRLAPLDVTLKSVLIIQAAMPAAIFPIVVTRAHRGDMPTALRVVLGTSAIGLITIPLWIGFGLHWIIPGR
jgi:predicted permease